MTSFQRQLNLYGFQRITKGPDKDAYYHELFLRGRKDLVASIPRIKVKGTKVRAKANVAEEPNFYAYPPIDEIAVTTLIASSMENTSLPDLVKSNSA